MIRRLRLILPPSGFLAVFALFYLAMESLFLSAEWQHGVNIPLDVRQGPERFFLVIATLSYGVFRVLGFHPFYRPDYRAWLELTPWTSRKPLPVGPVSLVWEDGVILSLLCLIATTSSALDPIRLLTVFLLVYGVFLGITFETTGASAYGYAVAFGLGLVIRLWHDPLAALEAATAMVLVAHLGLWRSLSRFPWSLGWQKSANRLGSIDEPRTGPLCGWPFDRLRPKGTTGLRIRRRDAILLGMLAGWWTFAIEGLFGNPLDRGVVAVTVAYLCLLLLPLMRLMIYATGYLSPISLWGRLVTRRWIIPGFDVVFVAPLCAAAVPSALFYELMRAGLRLDVTASICIAVLVAMTLGLGPSLERWRLTGRHRIMPVSGQRDIIKVA